MYSSTEKLLFHCIFFILYIYIKDDDVKHYILSNYVIKLTCLSNQIKIIFYLSSTYLTTPGFCETCINYTDKLSYPNNINFLPNNQTSKI